MRGLPETLVAPTFKDHQPSANSIGAAALPVLADHYSAVASVSWSYSAAPTGGELKLNDVAGSLLKVDIPNAGVGTFTFPRLIYSTIGTGLGAYVAAGGAGIKGKVTVKGYQMRMLPDTDVLSHTDYHHPAADTEATKTIAAVATETHVLDWVAFGYNIAPTVTTGLLITINASTVFQIEVPANVATAGPHMISWPKGLYGAANQAVVVSLAADSGGAVGKINFGYH